MEDNEEEEEPEQAKYFCAMCKSKLTYMKYTGTIWKCDNCQEVYDLSIQDRPISNKGFKITPHNEINRYPKVDEDDTNITYLRGVNLNEQIDSDIEILRQSEDGRIQHVRIRGNVTREEAYSKTRNL